MVRVLKRQEGALTIAGKGLTNNETLPIKPRVSPCNDDFTVISYSPLYTQFYTITLRSVPGLVNIFFIMKPIQILLSLLQFVCLIFPTIYF